MLLYSEFISGTKKCKLAANTKAFFNKCQFESCFMLKIRFPTLIFLHDWGIICLIFLLFGKQVPAAFVMYLKHVNGLSSFFKGAALVRPHRR